MMSVVILSVILLSVIMLGVDMLSLNMLSVLNAGLLRWGVAVVINLNLNNSTLITSVLSRPICESTKQVGDDLKWRRDEKIFLHFVASV
jgi:hypothetical protein